MAKIEKFKNFAQNFQRKWNDDTPNEIILPDLNTEEALRKEAEDKEELEKDELEKDAITEDVDWDEMVKQIKPYGQEVQTHLETLLADITEEGYYNVKVLASASPEGLSRSNRIYIDSEITLDPISDRPGFTTNRMIDIKYPITTSYEKEIETLRIKERTLNKLNAIMEDLKSEGCEIKMTSNDTGGIRLSIREKLDI